MPGDIIIIVQEQQPQISEKSTRKGREVINQFGTICNAIESSERAEAFDRAAYGDEVDDMTIDVPVREGVTDLETTYPYLLEGLYTCYNARLDDMYDANRPHTARVIVGKHALQRVNQE